MSRPSFGAEQRSRLACRAATARWSRQGRGVLELSQIRDAVVKALGLLALSGKVKAFLFGSYARGDATARSNVNIMLIGEMPSQDLLTEYGKISEALHTCLGHEKEIDLVLTDEATFDKWKGERPTAHYAVAKEGIRLV